MEGNKEGLPVSSYSWHRFLSLFPTPPLPLFLLILFPFAENSPPWCTPSRRTQPFEIRLDGITGHLPVSSLSLSLCISTTFFPSLFPFSNSTRLLSLSFSSLRDFSPDVRLPSFFPAKIVGKEWNGCNFTRHRFCRLFSRNNKRKGFLIIFRQTNLAIYARRESSNEIFTRLIFEIFEDITMKRIRRMIDKLSRD